MGQFAKFRGEAKLSKFCSLPRPSVCA